MPKNQIILVKFEFKSNLVHLRLQNAEISIFWRPHQFTQTKEHNCISNPIHTIGLRRKKVKNEQFDEKTYCVERTQVHWQIKHVERLRSWWVILLTKSSKNETWSFQRPTNYKYEI